MKVRDAKVRDILGSSAHEMVEFRIVRRGSKPEDMVTDLDFRRADFGLLEELLGRIPWDTALQRRCIQQNWLIFKEHCL